MEWNRRDEIRRWNLGCVGLGALIQYPVLGILDTGYRIQGYRKTGYRIAYRIQDYIQVPAA